MYPGQEEGRAGGGEGMWAGERVCRWEPFQGLWAP